MSNRAGHAKAHACRVRLWIDEAKDARGLEILDHGVGLPDDRRAGTGMISMRERAAKLGGMCAVAPAAPVATRGLARLPLPKASRGGIGSAVRVALYLEETSWKAPAFS